MNKKRNFIEKIKQDFEEEKNTKSYARVQRMAKTISENLYSENSHFIYELIQNAQDNSYKENIIGNRKLDFFVYEDGILTKNNEKGFEESHIESICDFNDSTKSKKKALGYIGEKGIGFKSVFAITDKPAIHSNGYCFYFKKNEYIEPYWIESLNEYPKEFKDKTTTNIYLPYSKTFNNQQDIENKIKDIEPILLLFLDNLDEINIYNNELEILSVKKKFSVEKTQDIVTIVSNDKDDKFVVYNKEIDCKVDIKEEKREGVKKRKIIIAFPLDTIDDTRLFAFLPTEIKTNLPFLIQADFLLTASRGEIEKDKEWNQWLLEEIVEFFIETFKNLQQVDKYKYLTYLDKKTSNYNFLDNYYQKILDKLQYQNIFLSTEDNFVKSSQICILDDYDFMYEYLQNVNYQNNDAEVYFYIHRDFYVPQHLIEKWEIITIDKNEFLRIIGNYSEFFAEQFKKNNSLFESLLEYIGQDYIIEEILLRLPIIPFDNAKNIIFNTKQELNNIQLFFKLDDDGILNNVFSKLKIISNKYQKKLQNIQFYNDIFEVKQPDIMEILKSLSGNDRFFINIENHVNLLVYIKNHYLDENSKQVIELLAKNYQFLSKNNLLYKHNYEEISYWNKQVTFSIELYISSEYLDSKNSIERVVNKYCTDQGKENIDYISELYLEYDKVSSKKELKTLKEEWKNLFYKLKINDDITLVNNELEMWAYDSQYAKRGITRSLKNIPFIASPLFTSNYDKNYKTVNFDIKALTKQDSIFLFKKFLQLVDIDIEYPRVYDYYRDLKYNYILLPWIDAIKNDFPIFKDGKKYPIHDFYLNVDKELQEFFYQLPKEYLVQEDINTQKIFGLKEKPDFNKIIELITNQQLKDFREVKVLFKYIHFHYPEEKIYLKKIPVQLKENIEYITLDKLIWKDGQEFKLIELELSYGSDFKKFFLEQIGIQEKPTIKQFIEYLKTKPKNHTKIFNKLVLYLDELLDSDEELNIEDEKIILINKKLFSLSEIIFNDENIKTDDVLNLLSVSKKISPSFQKIVDKYQIKMISQYSRKIQISDEVNDNQIQNIYIELLNFTWDYIFSTNQKKFEIIKKDKAFIIETKNIINGASANIILKIDVENTIIEIKKDIVTEGNTVYLSRTVDDRQKASEVAKFISNKIDIEFEKIERFYDKVYKLKDYTKVEYYQEENIEEPKEKDDKFDSVFEKFSKIDIEPEIIGEAFEVESDNNKCVDEESDENTFIARDGSINDKNDVQVESEDVSKSKEKIKPNKYKTNAPSKNNKTIDCPFCGFIHCEDSLKNHLCKEHDYNCKDNNGSSNKQEKYKKKKEKTTCPECNIELNSENLNKHLCKVHHKNCQDTGGNSQNNQNEENSFDLKGAIKGHEEQVDKKDDNIDPSIIEKENEYREQVQKQYDENIKKAGTITKKYYSSRKVKVGKKETKEFLKKQYLGYCQVCGFTFEQKNMKGKYFESFDWLSEKISKQKVNIIEAGSSLCLCSRCHSGLKYGDFEAKFLTNLNSVNLTKFTFDEFKLKTNTIVENDKVPICYDFIKIDMYKIPIRLLNENKNIFYTEEHFLHFYNLLTLNKN